MDSITATILILFGVAAGCIVARSVITYPPGDRISGPTSPVSAADVLSPEASHDVALSGRSHIDVLGDLQATGAVMHGPRLSSTPPTLPTNNHRAGEFPPIIPPATPPSPACCNSSCRGQ
jgi:hypothetical protein